MEQSRKASLDIIQEKFNSKKLLFKKITNIIEELSNLDDFDNHDVYKIIKNNLSSCTEKEVKNILVYVLMDIENIESDIEKHCTKLKKI